MSIAVLAVAAVGVGMVAYGAWGLRARQRRGEWRWWNE